MADGGPASTTPTTSIDNTPNTINFTILTATTITNTFVFGQIFHKPNTISCICNSDTNYTRPMSQAYFISQFFFTVSHCMLLKIAEHNKTVNQTEDKFFNFLTH